MVIMATLLPSAPMTIIVQVVTKVLMDRPCHQKITTGTIGAIGSIFTHGRNWLPLVIRSVIQGRPMAITIGAIGCWVHHRC